MAGRAEQEGGSPGGGPVSCPGAEALARGFEGDAPKTVSRARTTTSRLSTGPGGGNPLTTPRSSEAPCTREGSNTALTPAVSEVDLSPKPRKPLLLCRGERKKDLGLCPPSVTCGQRPGVCRGLLATSLRVSRSLAAEVPGKSGRSPRRPSNCPWSLPRGQGDPERPELGGREGLLSSVSAHDEPVSGDTGAETGAPDPWCPVFGMGYVFSWGRAQRWGVGSEQKGPHSPRLAKRI